MQYKHAIQDDSNKLNNTFKRNGIYQYQRRIPSDLVKVAAFGYKKNSDKPIEYFRCSLGTRDYRVARRLAALEDVESEVKFERKRQELDASKETNFIRRIKSTEGKNRKFNSLSAVERTDLVFRYFIELEIKSNKLRNEKDMVDKDLVIETLKEDHTHLSYDEWDSSLGSYLVREGIKLNTPDFSSQEFKTMCELLQRASSENLWRSIYSLQGEQFKEHDSYFRGLTADSDIPKLSYGYTVNKLCTSYLKKGMKSDVSVSTKYKYVQIVEVIEDFLGKETPLENITIEKAQELVAFLSMIPVNAKKHYPDISVLKASEVESSKDKPSYIAPKTQHDMFVGVKAIFRYAVEMGWTSTHPFAKKILINILPTVSSKSPPPPTNDDLNSLFSSDKYLNERKSNKVGEARFWTPLLCLFHGCRINEACQLLVSDIKDINGIHFIDIKAEDESGNTVKQIKNISSKRVVPIHYELIKIGFLEFVREKKKDDEILLFSALKANKKGSKSGAVGSWFGRIKKSLFIDVPAIRGAKGIHSLRHAFVNACREAKIEVQIRWKLGGWSNTTPNSENEYGDYTLKQLKEAIDKVQYKDVDLSALYPKSTKPFRRRNRRKQS